MTSVGIRRLRQHDIRGIVGRKLKCGRQNSDYGEYFIVELHGFAENARVARKAALPQAFGEQHHVVPSRLSLVGHEGAPLDGIHLQKLQQAARSPQPIDMHGSIASGDVEGARVVNFHLLKAAALGFPIHEIRIGSDDAIGRQTSFCAGGPKPHQPAGIREWQRSQQKGVDHAEDGRVGADAERERQYGDDAETGAAPQQSRSISHVL